MVVSVYRLTVCSSGWAAAELSPDRAPDGRNDLESVSESRTE